MPRAEPRSARDGPGRGAAGRGGRGQGSTRQGSTGQGGPGRAGSSGRTAAAPSRVRIVGGAWKRTLLPVADLPGLRPTPDRVRETLFNWLGQDLSGWRCLDLYAGTGVLGFECASRGAARVVLVERDPRALAGLRAVRDRLDAGSVEIVAGDAQAALDRAGGPFDLVLLDPPYGSGELARVLPRVATRLAPGGAVYVESDRPLVQGAPPLAGEPAWGVHRAARAGRVHYHLLHAGTG